MYHPNYKFSSQILRKLMRALKKMLNIDLLKKLNLTDNNEIHNSKVSQILTDLVENFKDEKIYVRNIKDALADRSFALLMLIFCIPNLIPHVVPGTSTISSIPLIFVTLQLVMGMKTPWFPKWLLNCSIKTTSLRKIIRIIVPYIKIIESLLKPRLAKLTTKRSEQLIAIVCLVLSILSILPIPLGSLLPAITIVLFSLAILEKDGIFVIFGIITSILSIAMIFFGLNALITILEKYMHNVGF